MTCRLTIMNKELPKMKDALIKAQKTGDPHKIVEVVDGILARFEEIGYPDCWMMFQRAKDDAQFKLNLTNRGW